MATATTIGNPYESPGYQEQLAATQQANAAAQQWAEGQLNNPNAIGTPGQMAALADLKQQAQQLMAASVMSGQMTAAQMSQALASGQYPASVMSQIQQDNLANPAGGASAAGNTGASGVQGDFQTALEQELTSPGLSQATIQSMINQGNEGISSEQAQAARQLQNSAGAAGFSNSGAMQQGLQNLDEQYAGLRATNATNVQNTAAEQAQQQLMQALGLGESYTNSQNQLAMGLMGEAAQGNAATAAGGVPMPAAVGGFSTPPANAEAPTTAFGGTPAPTYDAAAGGSGVTALGPGAAAIMPGVNLNYTNNANNTPIPQAQEPASAPKLQGANPSAAAVAGSSGTGSNVMGTGQTGLSGTQGTTPTAGTANTNPIAAAMAGSSGTGSNVMGTGQTGLSGTQGTTPTAGTANTNPSAAAMTGTGTQTAEQPNAPNLRSAKVGNSGAGGLMANNPIAQALGKTKSGGKMFSV